MDDPLRQAAEERRRKKGEEERKAEKRRETERQRSEVIRHHQQQAEAMLSTFLIKMRAAGYPGARSRSVPLGLLRRKRVRCWGWLTTDGYMVGEPVGTHGISGERLLPPEEWIPQRIRDVHFKNMYDESTTPVEFQLRDLAEELDRVLAANGIEI
jgi:hypothetical protein